jgi:hypothetical protein
MAYITIAYQHILIIAYNTRNNTASITGRITLVVNPSIVIEEETINNPISLEDLNHRCL